MKINLFLLFSALALAQNLAERHGDEDDDDDHDHISQSTGNMPNMNNNMDSNNMGATTGMDNSTQMEMPPSPMDMAHHHGRPILENPDLEPQQRKYWELYNSTTFFNANSGGKFNLWMHTCLSLFSFVFLAPLTLILSTDKRTQWLYVPLQTVQSVSAAVSILFLFFFSATAPKLYPGNMYAPFSVALLVLVTVHWVVMITKAITSYISEDGYEFAGEQGTEREAFSLDDMPEGDNDGDNDNDHYGDSEQSQSDTDPFDRQESKFTSRGPESSKMVRKLSKNRFFIALNSKVGGFSNFLFSILNLPLFIIEMGYVLDGIATAFVMGRGHNKFALLAHFIKGFVFFALGFIELARFFGACTKRGWAWNEIVVTNDYRRHWYQFWPDYPTVEYWQSFAMFFYGSTNVFLEHLGSDGVWNHKDLQHVSIAFMFFGGGLCGMILESRVVSGFLGKAFHVEQDYSSEHRRGWSFNPMPAFIVFWTGALMSHHAQETTLSTAIHIQWGTMFSLAAVLRLFTLLILSTRQKPQTELIAAQPQRPFTELLVAFLLVCGGLIFMSSNRETVEAEIYRGLDQMFTLNVSVGITVILMSIFILNLTIKGWASSRYT